MVIRGYCEQLYTNKLNNLEEMGVFLEICNLSRLNHKAIKNINRPITTKEFETIIKNIPTKKSPGSQVNYTNNLKKN